MGFLLHHSIDESAHRDPGHEAFRFEGSALGYEQLVRRANQLAQVLIEHGVRRSDRVGIYMLKGLDLPVALYGILKAGAAYVPIDPSVPAARARFIVEDCGIRHLVTNESRARRALALCAEASTITTLIGVADAADASRAVRCVSWEELQAADAHAPDVRVTEQDLAYIMYTSGSTGTPKGLMHTHSSGLSYAQLSARTYDVRPGDRLGNHSPLHFDMSTFEFLTGPWCGATSVIISEETTLFPISLGHLIEQERLSFWYSVPLALIQLVTHGDIERRDATSLRWVLFGGEPFPPQYLRMLTALWPHARFSNVYGPAEVNQCTYYHVPPASELREPVPIGRVWQNAEGLVVDADDREVSPGEAGELLIRSPTMMHGYWARPDLNAAAFFEQEPFPGFRKVFYRTGDLVRAREDGSLLFLGRKDRQIKVRGHRVELDEVEAVLASLDQVAEAAAVARRDAEDAVEILAAVVLRAGASMGAEDLRQRAAERLPPYAVPRQVHVRETFPRTTSGKIDRRALAELYR